MIKGNKLLLSHIPARFSPGRHWTPRGGSIPKRNARSDRLTVPAAMLMLIIGIAPAFASAGAVSLRIDPGRKPPYRFDSSTRNETLDGGSYSNHTTGFKFSFVI